ncbi:response regulator [Nitrospira calida]
MTARIFVVDSSPAVRRMVEQISAPEGFEVVGFQDGPTALEAAKRLSPDLIIADYHLDKMTFSGFCKELNQHSNLSDTSIVSLITLADRPDEHHLRSLGVRAFLKKPFQSEHLLEVIKGLQQEGKRTQIAAMGSKSKRKTWPPASQVTDTDEAVELSDPSNGEPAAEEREASVIEPSSSTVSSAPDEQAPPSLQADSHRQTAGIAEEAMRGLLGHLVQTMTERAERKVEELLPQILGQQVEAQVSQAVKGEIEKHLALGLSAERISQAVRDGIADELPKAMARQSTDIEAMVAKHVRESAASLIRNTIEQTTGELVDSAIRRQLPAIVREQWGSIDQVVKEAVQEAAAKQARELAEAVVRDIAERSIALAVQQMVPDLAEPHVKDEIKRLTA